MRWLSATSSCCSLRSSLSLSRNASTAANSASVILRPYQELALDACTDALKDGASRIGVSLPTGSGKTTVFLSLLSRITPPASNPKATRTLVIVNAIELARQAAMQATRLFPDWTVEIEQGAKHKASGLADVTMATYQTLLQSDRLAKFDPEHLKAIVVDEAHHAAAPSYRRLLSHFHPEIQRPDKDQKPPTQTHTIPIIGFSATFSRHDGLALGSVFERIVYHHDFLTMIKDQWLCNVRFTTVKASIDLREVTVSSKSGDFNATSLAHVINTETVNRLVVQTWLEKADQQRKSTLVFCVNLAHVRDLTNMFREAGIDARYVYSGTPAGERQALISAFKAEQFPVLINCAILTEGADIPNIDCVIVARPTRSRNVFAQMIGRGMRLSPDTGKTDCRIIDFVDSSNRVSGIVSTPTLFGLDPSEMIDDESTDALEARADAALAAGGEPPVAHPSGGIDGAASTLDVPAPRTVTYTDFDDPFAFAGDSSGAPHVSNLSPNAWVGCGGDVYVLDCLGKGYIRVQPVTKEQAGDTDAKFIAHFTPAMMDGETSRLLKLSPFARNRKLLMSNNLSDALRGADSYATKKVVFGPQGLGLLRSARWRRQPATDAQKGLLKKRWKVAGDVVLSETPSNATPRGTDTATRIANMTKGEAGNIITRLKHGAQSRYEKRVKTTQKVAARASKEMLRRAREHVQVGPLASS